MKVLFLLPALEYRSAAKEALLLARSWSGRHEIHVCVFVGGGVWSEAIRSTGAAVHCLDWTRSFDLRPLWRLRSIVRAQRPDNIVAWGMPALRALALVRRRSLAATICRQPFSSRVLRPTLSKPSAWLLRRVLKVAAQSAWEADQLLRCGMSASQIEMVRPGVECGALAPVEVSSFSKRGEKWPHGQRLVCMGALAPHKGYREAIWAADYLIYVFPDLRLDLFGAGAYGPTLRRFAQGLYHPSHMHFHGQQQAVRGFLSQASAFWAPSSAATGAHSVLEAMASGCPVVASDLPHFREIVVAGETGFLSTPGRVLELARSTRGLLHDANLRQQLGLAAQRRVQEHFSADKFSAHFQQLLRSTAA
ncbi:MAG: glycosyltransferase family 4 protein [Gemmataceae bacterium]|nr:glycosyltransferase family 4 protein [Gemmataceae bacterium]